MILAQSSDYPLLNLIWTMFVFFGFVLWFWLLIVIFGDLFGRSDASGWAKAGWTVLVIVLPFVGILLYLITQGRGMAERRRAAAEAVRTRFESDVRSIAGNVQPADQIAKARQLLDSGDITRDEYEALKRQALAPSGSVSTSGLP
ncbi:SHOCT domain-containing protein [Pseudonocardia asaccharolytica]|uniref:Membrane protein n=1 Tax=Pseudonocardia asaccharolytica DSM 44247 = NBRC 16224 TaxID=1123024 RepID=A0A511D4T8_9PSEU|nr:SHOCT domain-containing protein [Pseudonocardia asaccharolytica]GEL19781.1 membrane protein [Pseudonocardia asaccharolytica DSM 44247 = NBRC 16224]